MRSAFGVHTFGMNDAASVGAVHEPRSKQSSEQGGSDGQSVPRFKPCFKLSFKPSSELSCKPRLTPWFQRRFQPWSQRRFHSLSKNRRASAGASQSALPAPGDPDFHAEPLGGEPFQARHERAGTHRCSSGAGPVIAGDGRYRCIGALCL
jgi:hypothetical protein